jgi:HK97 family phage prohead protease
MSDFEIRSLAELTATDEGKLVGYAAVFNSRSHDLGGVVEVIAPGAFSRTLTESPDVLALVEHDANRVLARTTNGSLRITEDERGLRVEIAPANTSYARDLLELVRRGDVAGMSFRFAPYAGGATMDLSTTPPTRTLRAVRLSEVSVVVNPAYPASHVTVRAVEEARRTLACHAHRRMRLKLAEIE